MGKIKGISVLNSFKKIFSTRNFGEDAAMEYEEIIRGRNFNNFIINEIANNLNITKREAKKAFDSIFKNITDCLAKRETVRLVGFGTFGVRERASRMAINPRTGEKISVQNMNIPFFKADKKFKEKIK